MRPRRSCGLMLKYQKWFCENWKKMLRKLSELTRLSATVWSDRPERAKLINWRADLLSHAVVLLVNLTRESENTVTVSADEWIQCEFDGEPEDEFTVRLVLGEAIATEKFAV